MFLKKQIIQNFKKQRAQSHKEKTMLDIKRIRKNPEELVAAMKARRNKGADVSGILELDENSAK